MQLEAEPAVWVIPRDQLKVRGRDLPNKVMLSSQVINELHRLRAVVGDEEYIFPGTQGRDYVVREAIEKGLCVTLRLADRHSPHGWRSSFSTIAKESGEFKNEVVDLALDHIHDSAVARAYDRRERLAQRVRLTQWWSDHLASAERTSK